MPPLYFKVALVFTPATPISKIHLFAGRKQQLKSLARAIAGQGSHAIIYGERGVGKSSLGHVVRDSLSGESDIIFSGIDAQGGMSANSLWLDLLDRISIPFTKPLVGIVQGGVPDADMVPLSSFIRNPEQITTQEVRLILESKLPKNVSVILLVDEIDLLPQDTKRALADAIKSFSDYNLSAKFVLIGVGDSVAHLIEGHQSIERALVQIQMPRMTDGEVGEIIDKGLHETGMTVEASVKQKVVALSRGMPYYTHLLMLHAGQSAAENNRTHITEDDFRVSLQEAVLEKARTLKNEYQKATQSTKKAFMFPYVLAACALADSDGDGYFALTDVRGPLSQMLGQKIEMASFIRHAGDFCTPERGPILEKTGKKLKFRYRFTNPLMPTYVLMKALSEGLESATPIEEIMQQRLNS